MRPDEQQSPFLLQTAVSLQLNASHAAGSNKSIHSASFSIFDWFSSATPWYKTTLYQEVAPWFGYVVIAILLLATMVSCYVVLTRDREENYTEKQHRRARRIHLSRYLISMFFGVSYLFVHICRQANLLVLDISTGLDSIAWVGLASFALTGTVSAGSAGMDMFGCITVGSITALGGGTVFDLLTGHLPVTWVTDAHEVLFVLGTCLLTFWLWPILSKIMPRVITEETLFWTDTLGLALFAAQGTVTAVVYLKDEAGHRNFINVFACVLLSLVYAMGGGVLRDGLTGRRPRIFHADAEMYATPVLLGNLVTIFFVYGDSQLSLEATLLGGWVTSVGRALAVNHGLMLPQYTAVEEKLARRLTVMKSAVMSFESGSPSNEDHEKTASREIYRGSAFLLGDTLKSQEMEADEMEPEDDEAKPESHQVQQAS